MRSLRDFLLRPANSRIFNWFLSETDAQYQTVEAYHLLKAAYGTVFGSFYERKDMVVRLFDSSGMFSTTYMVHHQSKLSQTFHHFIERCAQENLLVPLHLLGCHWAFTYEGVDIFLAVRNSDGRK